MASRGLGNQLIRVLSVFGTRPEAIKMAPVVAELGRRAGEIDSKVCVSSQHEQMLDDVLELFQVVPDFDLDVMEEDQTPSGVASAVLERLEPILSREQPDWVLVQGDTTTTMAAAIAAFYRRVKVGHVESGLRTGDKHRPFPEEVNRHITSVVTDLHFAPTPRAKENLLREGTSERDIVVTGNTVIDALLEISSRPFNWAEASLPDLSSDSRRLILLTAHRRENFGEPLRRICRAVVEIARAYEGSVQVVYPVHLNPNVAGTVGDELRGLDNVTLLPPLDYLALVHVMKNAYMILTDSGGIQEEAPSLGVPVLVLRDVTERPEAVEAGAAKVVGTDTLRIVAESKRLLDDRRHYESMARVKNPFGDGRASERIVEALLDRSRRYP